MENGPVFCAYCATAIYDLDHAWGRYCAEVCSRADQESGRPFRAVLDEVRAAARWCAARGFSGAVGDPLPDLMGDDACRWIEAHLPTFRELVAQYGCRQSRA